MLVLKGTRVDADLRVEIRARRAAVPAVARDLERLGVGLLEQSRLFCLEGPACDLESHHMTPLFNSLVETLVFEHYGEYSFARDADEQNTSPSLDIFCRSGVTDEEGHTASLALQYAGLPDLACRAGRRFRFSDVVPPAIRPAVERALGNPLIHTFRWSDDPGVTPDQSADAGDYDPVATIALRGASDTALLEISRLHHLALDLSEMRAIDRHFTALERDPTDVELQSIALAWSEHCSHKTFRATIDFEHEGKREVIPGLLQSCIAAPSASLNRKWVRSAFVDNAGVIAFDRQWDLAAKVETHNHPSALEPYGGAHTGIGGVIRDVLAVSAEPIANTDVLCFGPSDLPDTLVPPGTFHPEVTLRGVVQGVADYGNNMGIPTVAGAVLFHPGYTANPLVYCGTLGLAPRGGHPRAPQPGDLVVVLGGRTGRDGIHGATMSSGTIDRDSVAGSAVQIGAPVTEKVLRDVLPLLRDERLYHAITDCGAGGLCSAVGEMASDLGVEVDLACVPLKYSGLRPWEIWLSEAQERMVLAVPQDLFHRLLRICRERGLEASVIGSFRDDGRLLLRHGDVPVADLDLSFMHGGCPTRRLKAEWERPLTLQPHVREGEPQFEQHTSLSQSGSENMGEGIPGTILLRLLSHPNIRSKEDIIRRYDHEVGAATVIKPLTANAGPSDAAVLQPLPYSWRGVAVSHGINPWYGEQDPHAMALLAVDEALRNLVAVGGFLHRTALLDNFCWGAVDEPRELGSLVRAVQGCRDAALQYGVPFISGKDSLRNTSVDETGTHSIPGTLLITAVGTLPDVRHTVTMDLKQAGSQLYLLGTTGDDLGGSHYLQVCGSSGGSVPRIRPETPQVMRRLSRAIHRGLVRSCHDLSEGGLAVAAAEMALAGELGLNLDLAALPVTQEEPAPAPDTLLFSESPGRFLVEVVPEHRASFEQMFAGLPCASIGVTNREQRLVIRDGQAGMMDLPLGDIEAAWRPPEEADSCRHRAVTTVHADDGAPPPAAIMIPRSAALVLTAPGVNCDRETLEACRLSGFRAEAVHLNQLLDGERHLRDAALVVLPGGFSYGDHLGAGAMLATILRSSLLDDLQRLVEDGRPVLGICNGFQVLARLGLLPGVSLVANQSARFECRWVRLTVDPSPCLFLQGLESLHLPIAHGEGRVVLAEPPDRSPLQPALRYRENPNGSDLNIAGLCNAAGNVFGLMPHPERYLHRYHHPAWQREENLPPLGLTLFSNAARAVRSL